MFFKFDRITQRLSSAPQDVSLGKTLESMKVTKVVEQPPMEYDFKPQTVSSQAAAEARFPVPKGGPSLYPVPNSPVYKKLMEMQLKFTANDGLLVWQKLPKDMPLYYISVGLVLVGTAMTFYTLKQFTTPPKNN